MEPVVWHPTRKSADGSSGEFSKLTSEEFSRHFDELYFPSSLSYLGATGFVALCVLGSAIEQAGTLDTSAVAAALRSMSLTEFYSPVSFDAIGQNQADMVVTQWKREAERDEVVYVPGRRDVANVGFPIPTWAVRACEVRTGVKVEGKGDALFPCQSHGRCGLDGRCICRGDYNPATDCENEYPSWERNPQIIIPLMVAILVIMVLLTIGIYCIVRRTSRVRLQFKEVDTGLPPSLELPPGHNYMLFLSHVWSTGQDQVAVIKRRLQTLLPKSKIFLDIEDLEDIGKLEEYVDDSTVVLIFLSRGYFLSKNCMREVRAAVALEKPIVLVHETNTLKGGAPLADLRAECPEDMRLAVFGPADNPRTVVPWRRIESFQLESLELIAEESLLHLPKYAKSYDTPPQLFVPGEISSYTWYLNEPHQIYASPNNPGAAEMARMIAEFAAAGTLSVPTDDELERWRVVVATKIPPAKQSSSITKGSTGKFVVSKAKREDDAADRKSGKQSRRRAESLPPPNLGAKKLAIGRQGTMHRMGAKSRPDQAQRSTGKAQVHPTPAADKPVEQAAVTNAQAEDEPSAEARKLSKQELYEAERQALQVSAMERVAFKRTEAFAEPDTSYFLLYLNADTFEGAKGEAFAAELRHILGLPGGGRSAQGDDDKNLTLQEREPVPLVKVIMVHEQEDKRGGCAFDRFLHVTPRDLVMGSLYKPIAISHYGGDRASPTARSRTPARVPCPRAPNLRTAIFTQLRAHMMFPCARRRANFTCRGPQGHGPAKEDQK